MKLDSLFYGGEFIQSEEDFSLIDEESFQDLSLTGNEIIEQAIHLFCQDSSEHAFMGVCMSIRKRMEESGHMLFPVNITLDENDAPVFDFLTLDLEDGSTALVAFTSDEERYKGPATGTVSHYIDIMFEELMQVEAIRGLLINPWGESVFLGKEDIAMILTPGSERLF